MSFEAIANITQAEAQAQSAVAAAQVQAKQMVADAETAGKAVVEAALARADGELQQLRRKAEEKARVEAGEVAKELENRKAGLQARAEARLDRAAALVVERIVNS